MAYHIVEPADIDPMPDRDATARSISDHVGLETLGLRLYTAEPGEQIPLVYHYHEEQEEAFYVLAGQLRVETPDREFVIETGQMFVATPGSPHRAFNDAEADGPLEVLAIGAPSGADAHEYEP